MGLTGHVLSAPLPVVESLDEARAAVAVLAAEDAITPGMPTFFDLLGQAVIGVFANGQVRVGEIVGGPGGVGLRVQVAAVLPW